jgi:DNA polymerase I-like protein with 3'-5' exonuclease and polymerase domains
VIQGEAGSMTKLAVNYIRAYLIEHDAFDRFQITNVVHDEINMEAKEEYAEECAHVMETAMVKAADVWCKTIKMKAEAVIGDYWAH